MKRRWYVATAWLQRGGKILAGPYRSPEAAARKRKAIAKKDRVAATCYVVDTPDDEGLPDIPVAADDRTFYQR